ncbi:MAG: hypothetical protein IT322_20390 [Anaerolineae bacterium]|nr:hypothetical protein [Anaerolineae bacterium]CAG0961935.1 hypothetical protein ANRL4_00724 [Anaerolineae bacterium]
MNTHPLRIKLMLPMVALVLALGACQGFPPVQVVIVVSATPDPNVIMITKTPAPTGISAAPTPDPTPSETSAPLLPEVTLTPSPQQPVSTLSAYPTETRAEIPIAQQDFQNGFMFWISAAQPPVIWVLIISPDSPNKNSGEWRIYPDTFVEGQPEVDPSLTPPADTLYQPRRGFGKLWRETPGLRDALGWATTPEFALTTGYVYQPGGFLDAEGKYSIGPGKHFLTTLDRKTFVMYESAQGFGRWERLN